MSQHVLLTVMPVLLLVNAQLVSVGLAMPFLVVTFVKVGQCIRFE